MGSLVGFVFTESTIEHLRDYGLAIQTDHNTADLGYFRHSIAVFPDSELKQKIEALEIHQIFDESSYLKSYPLEEFAPHFSELKPPIERGIKVKTKIKIVDVLDDTLLESKLKTFLKIRKKHSIWGVHLIASEFPKFFASIPSEYRFKYSCRRQSSLQDAGLIHLGTSCFDILITSESGSQ